MSAAPSLVFEALADPTRRRLIDWIATEGGGTATTFAARLPISRQAVSKHLAELEAAGLVERRRHGRELRYRLDRRPLDDAARWIADRADMWETSLRALSEHVATEPD